MNNKGGGGNSSLLYKGTGTLMARSAIAITTLLIYKDHSAQNVLRSCKASRIHLLILTCKVQGFIHPLSSCQDPTEQENTVCRSQQGKAVHCLLPTGSALAWRTRETSYPHRCTSRMYHICSR